MADGSARDRAIEQLTLDLTRDGCPSNDTPRWAVDALLAHPDVLHALAGTPRPDPREEAALDGLSPRPVVEADLLRAGVALSRIVAEHDHPRRQELQDVADWLSGRHGDPGSGWPVRLPVAPGVAAEQPTAVCGDVTGPNGVGGECALPPGHSHVDHLDGIGGEWPVAEPPAPAAEPTPNPAALLRLAASGRREYAASGPPNDELLSHEAAAFEQAARIVEGDLSSLYGALPSWRWNEIPARAAVGTTPPDAQADDRIACPCCGQDAATCAGLGHGCCDDCAEIGRRQMHAPSVSDPGAFTDPPKRTHLGVAENVPEHEALIATLTAAGWRRVGGRAGYYVRLRNDAVAPSVIVPVDPSAPDYRELMDAAHASVPAHPGVARVLARCDELDRYADTINDEMRRGYSHGPPVDRRLATAEVRALLAGGEQR